MDNSLKQRLVGAAILVVLVVAIVPEFLRGKAPPANVAPTLIPRAADNAAPSGDANAPLRSVTVDMRDPAPAAPAAGAGSPAAASPTGPASASSATPVAPSGAPAAVDRPAPDNTARAMAPAPPELAPATRAAPAATAAATLPKPVQGGPWVVQLGSFALKVSAERLAKELKAAGYPAYVSPVKRGARELFRVRVGPMANRPAASAYYDALRAAGKDVAIVPNQ